MGEDGSSVLAGGGLSSPRIFKIDADGELEWGTEVIKNNAFASLIMSQATVHLRDYFIDLKICTQWRVVVPSISSAILYMV